MLTVGVEVSQKIVISVVYLPPNPSLLLIQSLSSHLFQFQGSRNIVLLGDFNLPDINWDTLCGNSRVDETFCNVCFEFNLFQLISCSTHIHGSILDLILTNNEDLVSSISVHPTDNLPITSDHYIINLELSLARPNSPVNVTQHAYDYSKADFLGMNAYIFNSDIIDCLHFTDVEITWVFIKSIIYDAMMMFIPKFQFCSKQYPKWFIKDLRHQLNYLHTLRKTSKCSPSDHIAAKLSQAEDSFQHNLTEAKSNYETVLISNYANHSNPAIYHYIRSSTKSATIPSTVYLDATSANSDLSRANLFNQYFYSVFTSLPPVPEHTDISSHLSILNSLDFSKDEVYSALNQLDPSKATGIDTISPKVLKYCASSLTRPLCHLFNLSLSTGVIPLEWKVHLVVPVYKASD